MSSTSPARVQFINQILTSSFPGEVAKRFAFADGEVGAVYTLSRKSSKEARQPVILLVATFPPKWTQEGVHDFGIDFHEHSVASAQEAAMLLKQFNQQQAATFRASCRAA